jgi:LmbE family N-acetylglucosaminyl deacetylase
MISLKNLASTILFPIAFSIPAAHAALFIAAHPDDIALMMHKNAETDIADGYHTVLVLTTAGDAANGASGLAGNTMKIPYYRARLNSYENYVHFWQGLDPDVRPPVAQHTTDVILGKRIETVHMGNVVMYNLNLPDNGSLLPLATGKIGSVTSISPVNSYTLAQLKDVIREIIRINFPATPSVNLNTQDPDRAWNPGDHPDHLATGIIVDGAVRQSAAYSCVNLLFYRGYVIGGYAQTYTPEEITMQTATIGAMNAGLIANGNDSTWDDFHNNFIGKMDLRGIMGSSYCNF